MAYDYANRMFDDDTSKTPNVAAVAAVAVVAMADDDIKIDVQPKQITETITDSMCSSQTTTVTTATTTTTTSTAIATVAMQSSEEVSQINSALTHCTQLRSQLRGTLLYVQRLSSKYAHTDYMAVVRNLDNYRRQQQQQQQQQKQSAANSPYPKVRPCRSNGVNNENSGNGQIISSTPVKRASKMTRRRLVGRQELADGINNATFTTTSKRTKFAQLADAFDGFGGKGCGHDEIGTPKRSVREMGNQSNTISVCKIKVQRDIEATITHLQVMQKHQLKRRQQQLEQSLYQSCCSSSNLSSFGSTASLAASMAASPAASPRPFAVRQQHLWSNSRCMDQSSASSYGTAYDSFHGGKSINNSSANNSSSRFFTPSSSKLNRSSTMQFDEGKRTLERVERCYVTPLQRMHKRLIHLNASLVRTC